MLNRFFWICSAAITLTSVGLLMLLPTPSHSSYDLVIRHAKVWREGGFTDALDIAINAGKIEVIDKSITETGVREIDASNKYVLPALIDAHTHTFSNGLKDALRFGVATHIDMFTAETQLSAILDERNSLKNRSKADLFSAGMLATAPNGHGTQFGAQIETLTSPNQATEWVTQRVSEGSDFIKLVYMPESTFFKSIDLPTATAIIEAGHSAGLKVVAHISTQESAREMIVAGIDGLVHQFADAQVDEEFLALAKRKGIFIIPTLSVIAAVAQNQYADDLAQHPHVSELLSREQSSHLKATFGSHSLPGFDYSVAEHNTLAMHKTGIPVLAGSDAPNPGTTYGASLHQEIHLLVQAGLSEAQALESATTTPNQFFNIGSRGTIEIGGLANLLILNGSPINGIDRTLDINLVLKNGFEVNRQPDATTTIPDVARKISTTQLSRFAKGLNTGTGLNWMATDDSIRQGSSTARVELLERSLKVNSKVTGDFMFPWAGAAVFSQEVLDISAFSSVVFKVRGTAGQYSAMAFSGSLNAMPAMQQFSIDEDWKEVRLKFSNFGPFKPEQFLGFAFVANTAGQEVEYYLSDVSLD